MKKVRTIDILTKSEAARLKLYERKIIVGKNAVNVFVNKRRALRLLAQAKQRYRNSQSNL